MTLCSLPLILSLRFSWFGLSSPLISYISYVFRCRQVRQVHFQQQFYPSTEAEKHPWAAFDLRPSKRSTLPHHHPTLHGPYLASTPATNNQDVLPAG